MISSGLMYGILFFVKDLLNLPSILNVGFSAILGAIIYISLILIFKVINLRDIKQQLFRNKGV